jgi:hypothetical protein
MSEFFIVHTFSVARPVLLSKKRLVCAFFHPLETFVINQFSLKLDSDQRLNENLCKIMRLSNDKIHGALDLEIIAIFFSAFFSISFHKIITH